MRRTLITATGVCAAAVLWALTRGSLPHESASAPAADPIVGAPGAAAVRRATIAAALRRTAATGAARLPGSLRDTEIDGALVVGVDGRLLVTPALRRFFEYFFVAWGEEPSEQIRARIEAAIRARLSGAPQRDAFDLLDRYLTYRERGRTLDAAGLADDDLTARFEALRSLRREVFGARDAAALFGDQEAADTVAVAQHRIATDPTLSDDERFMQFAALEAQLPDSVRAARAAATAPLRLAEEEVALRAAGGTPEDIQALRERFVGSEAAERLAALDQQRAEWQGRVDAYRQERAAIDRDTSLTADQRDAAIETLRARDFSGPELMRIRALDGMQQTAAPPQQ